MSETVVVNRSSYGRRRRLRARRTPKHSAVVLARAVEPLESRFLLAGQVTITPTLNPTGNTNLTTEGNLDWVHIGYPANATKQHLKNGVTGPRLSPITFIGSGTPTVATTPGKTFTWTDARPEPAFDITSPTDPVVRVDGQDDGDGAAGPPPGAETEIHAFDNNTSKYLNFLDLNSGVVVTPANNTTAINGIRFYTANDAVERDPASYVLEGSNDGGATWAQISAGDLALPAGRNPGGQALNPATQFNQLVPFSNTTTFTSYRVTFPTIKNAGVANSMQIGEIELLSIPPVQNATAPTSDASKVSGAGNGFHFTAPASSLLRRLRAYVGVDGGSGTLTATLSDGSLAPVTQTLNDTNASGATLAVYQIDFKSNLENQTISIDWVANTGATATFSAATWLGGGNLAVTPTLNATGNTNLTTEGNLDWFHLGYPGDPTKEHIKTGVTGPRISPVTLIGSPTPVAGTTPGKTFTWTDAALPPATDITVPGDGLSRVDGQNDGDANSGNPPANEGETNAIDNTTNKYLNFLDLNSGVYIVPGDTTTVVNALRFYTANDAPERDPASYVFEGSADFGNTWTQISAGPLNLPAGRNPTGLAINPDTQFNQLVTFTNASAYTAYRVYFPTLKNAATANSMQIAEIELLNQPPAEQATATADAGTVTGNGNGYHFTVPASALTRRVRVYVSVDGGGTGTLTATLSDGTAAPNVQVLNDTNAAGPTTAVYQYDFNSGLDNQTLSFDFVASNGGTVYLSAASLIEFQTTSAPTGVTATAASKGKINVSWGDTSNNETGFLIERAPNNGGSPGTFTPLTTTAANVTQFVDTGLADNTTYFYRVSSVNALGATPAAGAPVSATTRTVATTGLRGRYWNDPGDAGGNPQGHLGSAGDSPVVIRIDPNIDSDYGTGTPGAGIGDAGGNLFSSQWDGTYTADYTGLHTFFTTSDDGARLFLDLNRNGVFDYDPVAAGTTTPNGELIVNAWIDQGTTTNGATNGRGIVVNLTAGQTYNFRYQYYEHGGGAVARAQVQPPFGPLASIASTNFIPPDATPPKLIAGPEFDRPIPAGAPYTPKQHIVLRFSEAIAAVNPSNITITQVIPGGGGPVYGGAANPTQLAWAFDTTTNTGVITMPGLPNEELPDGNYQLTLSAAGVTDLDGNPLDSNGDGTGGDDLTFNFYSLKGDTQARYNGTYNGDRTVNFVDFQCLELNFRKTTANRPSAADGDFDHDGDVDRADLKILLGRMGSSLSAPAPGAPVSASPAVAPATVAAPPKAVVKPAPKPVNKPVAKPVVPTPPRTFATKKIPGGVKDLLA